MLHFGMNMPLPLMMIYGSIMIGAVLLARGLLKRRLPGVVFPVLWAMVLVRFLVPYSLSSPLSMKAGADSWLHAFSSGFGYMAQYAEAVRRDCVETPVGDFGDSTVIPGTASSQNEESGGLLETVEETNAYAAGVEDRARSQTDGFLPLGRYFPDWRFLLPAVWLAGVVITAGILIRQKYCYSRKLRDRLLMEHNETVNTILRDMGMGHALVFTNDEIASPLVCGLVNPRIYLPTRMDFQNRTLLSHVLAHECMHIRHRDNWIKCAMLTVLCVNWFNPLVWIMSRLLSADLETACDEAVLRLYEDDERKSYAASLLTMAITGNRSTLLYSAFSRTEVEKRIRNVLARKKISVMGVLFSALLLTCSMTVFATGGIAPFSEYLSSFCFSSNLRWGVRATLSREIASGERAQERADDVILDILKADTTGDPKILEEQIKAGLAEEFGVEKSAFLMDFSLLLDEEERNREYEIWGLTPGEDGFFLYKGERIRSFSDEALGFWQSREEGTADVRIQRDRFGYISAVLALHRGDEEYDRRTREIERSRGTWR